MRRRSRAPTRPAPTEEREPGGGVRGDAQVGVAVVALGDGAPAVPDDDRDGAPLVAGEPEVEGGVEAVGGAALEQQGQAEDEAVDRGGPDAVPDPADGFVREAPPHVRLGVGARDDVDGLDLVLQGFDDGVQVLAAVVEPRPEHVFARGAHRHAVGGLVLRAERQALPHGDGLGVRHGGAVARGVPCVDHGLDPVAEAPEEVAVVVRDAGAEVELAARGDRAGGTRGHAELALQAGVEGDRPVVAVDRRVDHDGAEEDEVAEPRVDDVAVDAHLAQPGLDGHRFVRDHPGFAGPGADLHGEARARVQCAHAVVAERGGDAVADVGDSVVGTVELPVADRARGGADRLDGGALHERDQGVRPGERRGDVGELLGEGGPLDVDEPDVVGAGPQAKVPERGVVEDAGRGEQRVAVLGRGPRPHGPHRRVGLEPGVESRHATDGRP
jgi:hypothetical protein